MYGIASLLFPVIFLFLFPPAGHAEQIIELDQIPPTLVHQPPAMVILEGKAFEITAEATDRSGVARVILYFRNGTENRFHPLEMINTDRDNYAALIPGLEVTGKRLEYYIIADDRAGNRTVRGSPSVPVIIDIVQEEPSQGLNPGTGKKALADGRNASGSNRAEERPRFYGSAGPGFAWMDLKDQGTRASISLPGVTGKIRLPITNKHIFEIRTGYLRTEAIELSPVPYQGTTGTLHESLELFTFGAGELMMLEGSAFGLGVSLLLAQSFDRNLLDSKGQRLTRYTDETTAAPGLYFGYYRKIPFTRHFALSAGAEADLFFTGTLNYFYLPIEVVYGF